VLRNSHLYWYKAVQEVRHDTTNDTRGTHGTTRTAHDTTRHARCVRFGLGQTEAGLKEATGSLELEKCTVKKLDGKLKGRSALVISSSAKGEYLLLHEDEAEIDSWVRLLIDKGTRHDTRGACGLVSRGVCGARVRRVRRY
jgi:hypothetical protein